MKHFPTMASIAIALTLALFQTNLAMAAEPGRQQPAVLQRNVQVKLNYLLCLPKDYDQKESWPLLLFLHGAGERGDNLELLKKHGLPKLIDSGKEFPFIVASPQCPKDRWWEPFELAALLDEISEKYKVDPDRIYLTGMSMGGFGTWALAAYQPNRFAALVPICGGGDTIIARRLAKLPIWVFHGAKDPAVPLDRSQKLVDALKAIGSPVKFTIYPEAKHDSWTETYDNPQLYEWLLQQKRTPHASDNSKSIPFDTHDGYFVSNKFEPDAPTSFVLLKNQKSFDEVFGSGFVMNDKHHRLPPDAFNKKIVLAAIHRGKALWDYKVQSVTSEGKTLILRYSARSTPHATAEFACPLILSIDKGDCTAVRFVENDKPAKTIE